jgi:lysozyme
MLTGIDVHDGQGSVDWRLVSQSHSFAFVRGAYGTTPDTRVHDNVAAARAAGLCVGVYHFFRATRPAQDQADLFCGLLADLEASGQQGHGGDLPPVLDVEDNPAFDGPYDPRFNDAFQAQLATWLSAVEATGRQPLIYTRASFWSVIGNPDFSRYGLWVAHYTTAAAPRLPAVWPQWTFWQYTETGQVPGVRGTCDCNRFGGDAAALRALCAPAGAPVMAAA